MKAVKDERVSGLEIQYFPFLMFFAIKNGFRPHHFDTDSLFWSLERLFGCYYKIVTTTNPQMPGTDFSSSAFLDSDIEHFYIRHRILLNNIAFTTYQLLEIIGYNLIKPDGPSYGRNNEVSFFELVKCLKLNHEPKLSVLAESYIDGYNLFRVMRDMRDNLIHFKTKAIVFRDGSHFEFSLINREGTEPRITTETGVRLKTMDVFDVFNTIMKELIMWIDDSLLPASINLINTSNFKMPTSFPMSCLSVSGVQEFITINGM